MRYLYAQRERNINGDGVSLCSYIPTFHLENRWINCEGIRYEYMQLQPIIVLLITFTIN